ncbi:MAG TPA: PIG-L family deacetylase, partial [Polyangiaceae bacterium]|nr:PIG-L family deacetylase [Polyangiaceae bacterium]
VLVPDGAELDGALSRTTHLAIGAHHDDLELMAAHGVSECFRSSERWFSGVVVTDGAGSVRGGPYASLSREELVAVRRLEQHKAAHIGEYSVMLQLAHSSQRLKDTAALEVVSDLEQVLRACSPEIVYTHNLADKHDTHVAVALCVVAACRRLPENLRPARLIGCEVWRDLDWLCDSDKVVMPVDERENLHAALLGVFDSQIASGKRYDLAAAGRRRANATFFDAQGADRHDSLIWGMDLTPLLAGGSAEQLVKAHIARFESEVAARLARLSPKG